MPTPKAEALDAIAKLLARFRDRRPIDGLEFHTLAATAAYAHEQVEAIQEVKRVRKPKAATA
jgi:pyruvate-formate lyase-activating enzyme